MLTFKWSQLLLSLSVILVLPQVTFGGEGISLPPRLKNFLIERNLYNEQDLNLVPQITLTRWLQSYDQAKLRDQRYLAMYKDCFGASVSGGTEPGPECRALSSLTTTVSALPEFRIQAKNWVSDSTPVNYQNYFVENARDFILDPQFRCRRPSLYHFFHWYFDKFEGASHNCERPKKVLVSAVVDSKLVIGYEELPIDRLYQIHYLFASAGTASFSKYGHAMLRLVFCSPHRKEMGPQCLEDLPFHRVVSFRASVIDPEIDPVAGMDGRYPSILFVMPMISVLKEYNGAGEFRDLVSVPLKLNKTLMGNLVETIFENHLSYQGKYFFLSNNCATETLRILQQTLFMYRRILGLDVVRPDSLYDQLIKVGLGQGVDLEDFEDEADVRKTHIQTGLFYASEKPMLEKQWEGISNLNLFSSDWSIEDYWQADFEFKKSRFTSDDFKKLPPAKQRSVLHRAISLEAANIESLELSIMKTAQKKLAGSADYLARQEESRTLRLALTSPQNFDKVESKELTRLAAQEFAMIERMIGDSPEQIKKDQATELQSWLQNLLKRP
jgi:hypothetical protein